MRFPEDSPLSAVSDLIDKLREDNWRNPQFHEWMEAFHTNCDVLEMFIARYVSQHPPDDFSSGIDHRGKYASCVSGEVMTELVRNYPLIAAALLLNFVSLNLLLKRGSKAFAVMPDNQKPEEPEE